MQEPGDVGAFVGCGVGAGVGVGVGAGVSPPPQMQQATLGLMIGEPTVLR